MTMRARRVSTTSINTSRGPLPLSIPNWGFAENAPDSPKSGLTKLGCPNVHGSWTGLTIPNGYNPGIMLSERGADWGWLCYGRIADLLQQWIYCSQSFLDPYRKVSPQVMTRSPSDR